MAELRAAVLEYGRCWWHSDPHVLRASSHDPDLDARLKALGHVRSIDVFRLAGRIYTPERQLVHAGIVGRQVASGPKPAIPTVYFTIGCMGAGKSTVLRKFVEQRRYVDT